MGWGKKFKRLGGKLLKAAVKIAPVVATGGLGAVPTSLGAIAASKLRSAGDNRTKRKLLEKISGTEGLSAAGLAVKATPGKRPPTSAMNAPRPRAEELVAMRDPAVRELLNSEARKGVRAKVARQASATSRARTRWAQLDADTKSALTTQFKEQYPKGASDTVWSEYVLANS